MLSEFFCNLFSGTSLLKSAKKKVFRFNNEDIYPLSDQTWVNGSITSGPIGPCATDWQSPSYCCAGWGRNEI